MLLATLSLVIYAYSDLPVKVILTGLAILLMWLIPYLMRLYNRITMPLNGLANVVESIRLEDYSLTSRAQYKHGVMPSLLLETTALVNDLQQRKDRYAQHVYLIYQLIEQLDSPVLVFNEDSRLVHANAAFSQWYGQSWRNAQGLSSKRIGLIHDKNRQWSFRERKHNSGWQIRSSRFLDDKHQHQLVILINIKTEVRKVQQDSWQQIIRVLSHEIRNSLTPIRAMTELLREAPDLKDNARIPLEVIEARSVSLQEFVERYADTSKTIQINKCVVNIGELIAKITPLFLPQTIDLTIHENKILADPVLLEQVLINLLQNAAESQASRGVDTALSVEVVGNNKNWNIHISDKGVGIANPANLFVPLYTTKEGGQGIGLVFCNNVIDQHGGTINIKNRRSGGVRATIVLPKKADNYPDE
jgi:nitrogen fixation/metabolism regulation signal transduction histidine kinase